MSDERSQLAGRLDRVEGRAFRVITEHNLWDMPWSLAQSVAALLLALAFVLAAAWFCYHLVERPAQR